MSDSSGYRDPFDISGTEGVGQNGGMPPQFWNNLAQFGAATMVGANARTPQGFLANGSGPLGPVGVGLQAGMESAQRGAQLRSSIGLQHAQAANLGAEAAMHGAQVEQIRQAMDLFNRYMSSGGGPLPLASGAPGTQPTGQASTDPGTFVPALYQAESGLNPTKVNDQGYAGLGQFGAGRLATLGLYSPSAGEDLKTNQWKGTFNIPGFPGVKTLPDFLHNPDAQNAAMNMHLADIDQNIAATPGAQNFDQNGLRAVAHLGGTEGLQKFVTSGGQYNPADSNGAKLSDYYKRFASAPLATGRAQQAQQGGGFAPLTGPTPPYQVAQAGNGPLPTPPMQSQPPAPLQMNMMPTPGPWQAGQALGNQAAIMGLNPYTAGFGKPLEAQSQALLNLSTVAPAAAAKAAQTITTDRFGNRYQGNQYLGRGSEVKEIWDPVRQEYVWGDVGALGPDGKPLNGAAAPSAKPGPMQTEFAQKYGGELANQFEKIDTDAAAAKDSNYLFDNLRNDSKSWQMGKFADIEGDARAWLSAIAGTFDIKTPELNQKLSDYQAFSKSSGMLLRTAVHDTSSRAAVQEYSMIGKTLPQPTTSEEGFGQVADQWQGLNDFRLAKQKVKQAYMGNPQDFNVDFNSNVSPTAFMINRMMQTPVGQHNFQLMMNRMQETPEGKQTITHMMKGYNYARQNGLFEDLPPVSGPTQAQP